MSCIHQKHSVFTFLTIRVPGTMQFTWIVAGLWIRSLVQCFTICIMEHVPFGLLKRALNGSEDTEQFLEGKTVSITSLVKHSDKFHGKNALLFFEKTQFLNCCGRQSKKVNIIETDHYLQVSKSFQKNIKPSFLCHTAGGIL